jgi:hypothetical protein
VVVMLTAALAFAQQRRTQQPFGAGRPGSLLLHHALANEASEELVELLIQHGADVNATVLIRASDTAT